jgi:hypothetical protein
MSLTDLSYRSGKLEYRTRHATEPEWVLSSYLEDAKRVLEQVRQQADLATLSDPERTEDFEQLRWFPMPAEAAAALRAG